MWTSELPNPEGRSLESDVREEGWTDPSRTAGQARPPEKPLPIRFAEIVPDNRCAATGSGNAGC